MNIPVFDLHCDTALSLTGRDRSGGLELRNNRLHIDLNRAAVLPAYAQCFACFTTPFMEKWYQKSPEEVFQEELCTILSQLEKNQDMICQAFRAQDVRRNAEKGLMSAILTLEGTAGIDYDAARLEDMYQLGFRIVSLVWNEQNPLAGSHVTGGGLTDRGREFVKEAQRLGLIVDVSHISDEGFWDIMKITEKPIVATHSNSRAVCDNSRNLTDDMFRAIMETGGVAGFNQCAAFVGEKPNLDTVCDHFVHLLALDPEGSHIALGADLDGCDALPDGFKGVESYPTMAQKLLTRGVDEKLLMKIYWENALGVMETCCM